MSRAFVKEPEGGEGFEEIAVRPVSTHTNFVTPDGLARIETEVARYQAEFSALTPGDKAEETRVTRDLNYWTSRLGSAQLVEPVEGDTVRFGSTVEIVRDDDTRQSFRIVGEDEADPAKGSIAYVSPMARALTGRSVGDTVEVNGHEIEIEAIS